ncbi:acyl-CoA dehydrogenase family protein [Pseudonocardia acaciae]|uniref:acyl-CoA dehydrogenase family protein n=1 Tax=Pseudonocardia acaciae TaxID=551276 RepID=UPI00048A82BF|nr:acyl-CoA dehydrogenase family protein [Pseudonocardia acaciae]
MDLRFGEADEEFRAEVRGWLDANLRGEFAELVGTGGPGREHEHIEGRIAWERRLGEGGWIGLGWPERDGGRALSWERQVIFHEEYARAGAPGRVGHIGEQLLGPTLLMFGTDEQRARFLPGILSGTELWCQGYSEPGAGSDLAAVRTRAVSRDGQWHIDGQKVWTSLAQHADWCFVLARTDPDQQRHRGLSYLLVPMNQPGVQVRPIVQLTGTAEFNEVFFDDARAAASDVVGEPGEGWKVAMGTLAVERGVSTFGQQMGFARELDTVVASARESGALADPEIAERLLDSWIELRVLRYTAVMTLGVPAGTTPGTEANVAKLMWAPWHQRLGELAVDVLGADATVTPGADDLTDAQVLYLFTRADTIYGGSNEVQRNVIAQRMLGLPRERGRWT